jgi:hypothetical protein
VIDRVHPRVGAIVVSYLFADTDQVPINDFF